MKTLTFPTSHKTQLMDISKEVQEAIIESGVKDGIVVVFSPHTTTSIMTFENVDPKLERDLLKELSLHVNDSQHYEHVGGNAVAHLKSALNGSNVSVPVVNASALLGKWQGIFFAEFDGPRQERNVYIKVIAG